MNNYLIDLIDYATYFSYIYKSYGEANNLNDMLLTWAGSTSAILGGLSRLSNGYLFDFIGFKTIFIVLMVI
jgi:hypothetical protein